MLREFEFFEYLFQACSRMYRSDSLSNHLAALKDSFQV
jgi:hypothetical protein